MESVEVETHRLKAELKELIQSVDAKNSEVEVIIEKIGEMMMELEVARIKIGGFLIKAVELGLNEQDLIEVGVPKHVVEALFSIKPEVLTNSVISRMMVELSGFKMRDQQ